MHDAVADFVYANQLAHNTVDSQTFWVLTRELLALGAMDAKAGGKSTWKPHSQQMLGGSDLDEAYGEMVTKTENFMLADSSMFALTVSSDGWRNTLRHSVQNFMISSPRGS